MVANPLHILTIDLEDWFHSLAPDPAHWGKFERRAAIATEVLLPMLASNRTSATFFVLGDVARQDVALIRRVASAGHEIGTHGMQHRFVYQQTPEEFRPDLRESLRLLEDITGQPVRSYRAPYFSITTDSLWALDILGEEGIRCDSSVFPVRNPRYGLPGACRIPHEIRPGLWEWPVSTLTSPLGNVPFCGGVYFRFLPLRFTQFALRRLEQRGEPVVFYLHPWEIDPRQPRYRPASRFLYYRHYHGLQSAAAKLERVLARAPFISLSMARSAYCPAGAA